MSDNTPKPDSPASHSRAAALEVFRETELYLDVHIAIRSATTQGRFSTTVLVNNPSDRCSLIQVLREDGYNLDISGVRSVHISW